MIYYILIYIYMIYYNDIYILYKCLLYNNIYIYLSI